jgi:hypothetical protein
MSEETRSPSWKPRFPNIDVRVPVSNGGVPVSVTSFLSPDAYDIMQSDNLQGTSEASLPGTSEMAVIPESASSDPTPTTAAALLSTEQPRYGTWGDSEADGLISPTTADQLFNSWPTGFRQPMNDNMMSAMSLASGKDILKTGFVPIVSCNCGVCGTDPVADIDCM